jgi:hypothetical protein
MTAPDVSVSNHSAPDATGLVPYNPILAMTTLFIPTCGDRLRLTAPWKFVLYLERRNIQFAKKLGIVQKDANPWDYYGSTRRVLQTVEVELPTGTVIECSRVYIRQFNKSALQVENDYDSITWMTIKEKGKAGKGKPQGRFWVKLPDCYTIEYELGIDGLYRDRVKAVKEVHSR